MAPVQPKYHSQYISQVPVPSCVKVLVQNGMGPLAVTRCRAWAQWRDSVKGGFKVASSLS